MKALRDETRSRRRRLHLHARARRRDRQAGRRAQGHRAGPGRPGRGRLAVVGPVSARIMRPLRPPGPVRWTTDLDDGLDGAGAVLLQLRVGGQAARQRDETWPLECGCVGQETTGAGGLRQGAAHRARRAGHRRAGPPARAAADAWIIDFTNPVGHRHPRAARRRPPGDRAVQRGHRVPAACSPRCSASPPERVALDHVGLNHLTWERAVLVDGTDVLPGLHRHARRARSPATSGCRIASCMTCGAVPSYYLRYYYAHDEVVAEQRSGRPGPRRSPRSSGSCSRCTPTRRWTTSRSCCAPGRGVLLRGGRGAARLAGQRHRRPQVVNVRNAGTLPFLPTTR